jgi:hypothetical protein
LKQIFEVHGPAAEKDMRFICHAPAFSATTYDKCITNCFVGGKPRSTQIETGWFVAFNDIFCMYRRFCEYICTAFRLYVYTIACQSSISAFIKHSIRGIDASTFKKNHSVALQNKRSASRSGNGAGRGTAPCMRAYFGIEL